MLDGPAGELVTASKSSPAPVVKGVVRRPICARLDFHDKSASLPGEVCVWFGAAVAVATLAVTAARACGVDVTAGGHPFSLEGYVELRKGFKIDPDTPSDQLFEELWLRLRTPLGEPLELDTTFAVRNGGPATESDRAGFYAWDDVFQSVSPALEFEEATLTLRLENADIRAGKQKLAWGRLDRWQPTDVVNTERFTDPFLRDEDQNKIGVPAVQGAYYVPERDWIPEQSRITLVWIPWYRPYRFPRAGERWFPPAGVPPSPFFIPEGLITLPDGQPNPPLEVPVGFQPRNVDPPPFGLNNSGYAARLSAFSNGIDYSIMYYHGFDLQPAFRLSATVFPHPISGFRAETELTPVFRQVDVWGGDIAYAWGRFTFRAEGAYVRGRPFSRDLRFLIRDPTELRSQIQNVADQLAQGASSAPIELPPSFVVRDALEWGVGVDTTVHGYFLLLQLNQTDVFANDLDLLIRDVESRIIATARKSFWHDDVQLQVQGVYGASSDYTLLLPRATYRLWRGLEVQGGYLFIAGRRSSVVGQYKQNDEGFVRLRYLF
jgi:hypothetical protein